MLCPAVSSGVMDEYRVQGCPIYATRRQSTRGSLLSISTDEPDEADPEEDSDDHPHAQRHQERLRGHLPFRICEGERSVLPAALSMPPLYQAWRAATLGRIAGGGSELLRTP